MGRRRRDDLAPNNGWLIGAAVDEGPRFAGDPAPGTFRLIASDGLRVLHMRGLTAKQVAEFDPERTWAIVLTNTTKLPK